MAGTRELVGIYEIGDPNEMDIRSEEWTSFLVHTMQAIAHSVPPPPKGMIYETTTEWRGNSVYVLLTVRTEHSHGWNVTPRLTAAKVAFDADRLPDGAAIETLFRVPAKGTPESQVRLAYFRALMKRFDEYEAKLRYIDMALKGQWPGESGEEE